MSLIRPSFTAFIWLSTVAFAPAQGGPQSDKVLQSVKLPPGLRIKVVIDQTPGAHSMAWGDRGAAFTSDALVEHASRAGNSTASP